MSASNGTAINILQEKNRFCDRPIDSSISIKRVRKDFTRKTGKKKIHALHFIKILYLDKSE